MTERKDATLEARILTWLERHWRLITLLVWLGFCAWFIWDHWLSIQSFGLGDTDDNMRMGQVRALLHGQDWFDLRNYRMNPPYGANIHWSRLVDLPIAGLILLLRPFIGGPHAEMAAVAIAPLLPYGVLFVALALTARRLVHPWAFFLPFVAIFFAGSTNGMFMPERIDHHGWQLALLAVGLAGIADPRRRRGGATLGIATALSLVIGLEMIIYLAIAGAAMALFWVVDRDERDRLAPYALTLAGGCGLGFLIFASYANRQPVCDALSPVWLSNALLGGALLFGLAWISPGDWKRRLALAVAAGAIVAAFHAVMWPHCLHRLEGVSPEVDQLWLSHVREARPVFSHGWRTATAILALPVTGAIGWLLLAWTARRDPERLRRAIAVGAPAIVAMLLLSWQTRMGPAAQMMATAGTAALVWILVPVMWNSKNSLARVLGTAIVMVAGVGAAVPLVLDNLPAKKTTPRDLAIGKANRLCNYIGSYRPIEQLPKGMVFTFVDLGPRLITVTHHNSVTGPYHRNGQQIVDIMNAFRGSADQARAIIIDKYHSDYLLDCPNSSTTTIFLSETPKGFYAQLNKGQAPAWLQPLPMPKDSPFRMWRIVR